MREFAKFITGFWTSPAVQSMSDDGKLLACYLISGPHSNQAGCYRLPVGYVQGDLGWSAERVRKGLAELFDKGFAQWCERSFWVLIFKALKHTPPENPNQQKHVVELLLQAPPESSIAPLILQIVTDNVPTLQEPLRNRLVNRFGTVPPTVSKQREGEGEKKEKEKEKERERERERERESTGANAPARTRKPVRTRLPENFGISDRVRTWAQEKGHSRLDEHLESFRSKAKAKGYEYVDWDEAFMNAIRDNWAQLPASGGAAGYDLSFIDRMQQEKAA